jgi:very-short-patch-repair endonuclease
MADIARARQLRKDETWAEKLMWRWLRDRRFNATNSAASIPSAFTISISFARRRN